MGNRGRERQVRCEKCGRQVRRDKAVFIEKMMFSNPLDRNQVQDEQYRTAIFREVAYCPSCGKHGRIYQKKTEMLQRQRERARQREAFGNRPPRPQGQRNTYSSRPQQQASSSTQQTSASQQPAQAAQKEAPKEGAASEGSQQA